MIQKKMRSIFHPEMDWLMNMVLLCSRKWIIIFVVKRKGMNNEMPI